MEPKYKFIKQLIKSKIIEGTIIPHQKVSSESEMMKQFHVSRHTVRLAVGELVNEGWLYKEQGAGTFCADRVQNFNAQSFNSYNKSIAIITTFISEYIFPAIIRGAEAILSKQGYHVNIFNTQNDYNKERKILETIQAQHYDGVIIEPTRSASSNPNLSYYLNLERLNIPYIMLNAYYEELEPLSITVDDVKGGFIQTEHLIKLGHKDIMGIYKTDDKQGVQRLRGFIKAHRSNGIAINPNNIVTYNTSDTKAPIRALEKSLSLRKDFPTALTCYNDQLVLQLLDVIRMKGLQVPKDLSIVGFDNSILAEVSEVKLTSVTHPKHKMGEEAARLIIDLVKNNNGNSNRKLSSIVYEPELIIRNSTGKVGQQVKSVVNT
ncbi:GntR family transcriptional regulator [Aquibacillus rhizosphaerae]|uniref:GntR family transcriptional regulator n=1 Tax=Aquibacillus rhizosphaerae TaxID=3051431 RepID=A0ABT7KZX6_9BACI|nr:GntR family transcriptional regulator [Aquibacillus sp. LR5S19]MDL4839027.1 GntR family transcriptional regulator [Aquibacillus sp. LR5S19]